MGLSRAICQRLSNGGREKERGESFWYQRKQEIPLIDPLLLPQLSGGGKSLRIFPPLAKKKKILLRKTVPDRIFLGGGERGS